MPNIQYILKEYWGHEHFRPLQEDIINSILAGKDTLALLPTGGGKSICFQVPAMAMDGLCLVVSPLIALMKDQVENLRRKGITAYAIYSGMSRRDVINALKVATESNCKFLYVSPERLETNLFKEYLPALDVNLIAVDEAHCISQWGYDFRPPYLRIAALREELPDVPVLALTASATPMVQEDICEKLAFVKPAIFRQSFERPNLSYSLFEVDTRITKIVDILQKVPGSSIVYCKSRKRTQTISEQLNTQGIQSDFYHAGLSAEERNRKQENWIKDKTRVIVCTNAFGMGIDKPNVRTVIHADVPDCIENYYQEAGRAGRDGEKAYAVLLHDYKVLDELAALPDFRFPSLEDIRTVYNAIGNYLQIPVMSGDGVYYNFDITDFTSKFKLDAWITTYALKALEQDGWLSFNEQVLLPSRVQFVTGKDWLYEFEKSAPVLEPLIHALLRTYEGIFDMPVSIQEKSLVYILALDEPTIIRQLKILDANAIIEYTPQKDKPQIYFLRNRVKKEDLYINQVEYGKRKKQFQDRVEAMMKFITDKEQCRSQYIAAYFGDKAARPCGICDNCLNSQQQALTPEEFNLIQQRITSVIGQQPITADQLFQQLTGIKKEKAWKVIQFMQAEQVIAVDEKGGISKVQP
ncbi:RecQ family ATP-dependent DNA helicase [Paraflavitalea pollutisoli]|uniref:RecQ family ATP-dependent DNA helicase n=1 Tax=Paraflavitalea pollutisoli TaxID=3034143 RepID=UPI0023EB9C21|nr:ATP-dependent DNA helicase RecQ [Paraflavitalea sp. H1-2-19X]